MTFFVEASIVEVNLFHGGRKLRQIRLFGRPEDVAFAKYAYTFLCRTFRKRWNVHRNNYYPPLEASQSRGFFMGMAAGFAGKLHLQREAMESQKVKRADGALIVVGTELAKRKAEVEAAYMRAHPGIGKKHREAGELSAGQFVAGVREGHQIELNRPVAASEGQKRIGNVG